jgi:predicted MFS family arabinose efflux permease
MLMAMPGVPLWLVCVAMAGVAMVGGPFKAARLALLPEVLEGEAYVAALALRSMTIQVAQLLGFAVGGVVVGLITPRPALAVDAATFLLSTALVLFGVPRRPAPTGRVSPRSFLRSSLHGARLIAQVPGLRPLFVLGMLAGFYITPEGLAAPWAAELGAPPQAVGLIMGAPAVGLALGAWIFTKFVRSDARARLTGPLAALAGVALTLCVVKPGLVPVLALLTLSGVFTAYQVQVGASFGRLTPADGRAQVMGLLNSGVLTAQGIGVLLSGLLAELVGVPATVAIAGAVGVVIAVSAAMAWSRATAGDPAAR